jgi:16S rRNA (guanine527-N7)-methyltransferase
MNPVLLETLRTAQRFGFFGSRPIEQAVEHSMDFVAALGDANGSDREPDPASRHRLVDLGTGGGLPGLVIADARPDLDVVLLDRRQKRTDFLERAVSRIGSPSTRVMCCDVAELISSIQSGSVERFDVVTARGFGPPEFTLRSAAALVAGDGRIVISEPPEGDRWDSNLLDELGLYGRRRGAVRLFRAR